jgi:hypothetical protein
MSDLEDRGEAYEKQFAFQEKQSFDVEARCSKLFGLWAAEKIGLSGSDADTYALSIVEANLEEPGFDDVLRAVRKDFKEKSLDVSDAEMCKELDKALAEAKRQLDKDSD